MQNPTAFSDTYLKPQGFKAGRIHLNGYDAMAFSRIRHNLPRGDFDRSANQQRVLRGIQAKVRAQADVPGFIERGVVSVMQHLSTDLGPAELFRLAQADGPGRAVEDHQLRGPGRDRQHRRRQRGVAVRPRRGCSATRPARTPRSSTADRRHAALARSAAGRGWLRQWQLWEKRRSVCRLASGSLFVGASFVGVASVRRRDRCRALPCGSDRRPRIGSSFDRTFDDETEARDGGPAAGTTATRANLSRSCQDRIHRRPASRKRRRSRKKCCASGKCCAPPAGFEPAAPGTGNQCSIP